MKKLYCFRFAILINMLLISLVNNAQNVDTDVFDEVLEEFSVNNEEVGESFTQDMIEELSERITEPLNLNAASREQLEQFPFLNDVQVENLLAYLYIQGEMQTVYELQLVPGMDKQTIDYLLPFICVRPMVKREEPIRWKQVLRYGKQEVLTRLDIPLYRRKGYEKTYLGTPLYHSLRYGFRYRENLYAGITAEKDSGEPFGALHNRKGYDYYSFYFFLRNIGRLKALAVGNYRLSFGQGLVMNNGFMLGKTTSSDFFQYRSTGIGKHSSTDEYNYFRGMALAVSLSKSFVLSAFYSHRKLDGKVSEGAITSIYKTGLYRSRSEAEKKHAFPFQLAGGNFSYTKDKLKLGVTGIYYFFSKPYLPELRKYARYNLQGRTFYNIGADYQYRWNRLLWQGEAAIGKKGFAILNRLLYSPSQIYKFMLVHRYYAHDYWAMFARSFAESAVQNENGWYLAGEVSPIPYWSFFGSIDLFSFPWWKYRISKPSQGVDGSLKVTYSPKKIYDMYVSYRYKQKERDVTGTGGEVILPVYHHRLRYRLNISPTKVLSFRTTIDGTSFRTSGQKANYGYQFTQAATCRLPWIPLIAGLQGSYFHTDDYDSRVYVSEKGLIYSFYTPSFQGEGIRFSFHARYDLNSHWMVIGKYGQTVYYDRDEIGSGYDMISGNKKADVQLQLRFKF